VTPFPQAAKGATSRGALFTANEPGGPRPGRDVGILYAVGASRRSVQNPEGRPGDPPDPSSEGGPNRSAHLCGLHGLCPACDVTAAFAGSGAGINASLCPGKIRLGPNDRRPSSDHRWSQSDHVTLYTAGAGAPDIAQAVAAVLTQSAATPGNGQRRSDPIAPCSEDLWDA